MTSLSRYKSSSVTAAPIAPRSTARVHAAASTSCPVTVHPSSDRRRPTDEPIMPVPIAIMTLV